MVSFSFSRNGIPRVEVSKPFSAVAGFTDGDVDESDVLLGLVACSTTRVSFFRYLYRKETEFKFSIRYITE